MRIVITGSDGMLGSDLMRVLGQKHRVIGLTRKDANITEFDKTVKAISDLKPELVIHCAANTHVDGCEQYPESAYSANGLGTRNVAVGCQKAGAAMVYISTDYIFDGTKPEPYLEWDQPSPINVYGRSKLIGEQYTASLLSRYYIIRTSWLYGRRGRNFVAMVLRRAEEGKPLSVVDDQVGSPTYTLDLAGKIGEIIERERYGIYHVTNSGTCSWYQFAQKIVEISGHKLEIRPVKSSEYRTPARRPANSVLRNLALELEGIGILRHWQEAVEDFIREL